MALSKSDLAYLDARYKKIVDCDFIRDETNTKLANDDKRIDLMIQEQQHMRDEQQRMREDQKNGFRINNALTSAVLVAIIGAIVAFYFFK